MMSRSRQSVPFTWELGVDNRFGWLRTAEGFLLVEPRLFHADALVVDLGSGVARRAAADGTLDFFDTGPTAACALVGIPEPATREGVRLDPFHVERHRSEVFAAVAEIVRARRLPCGSPMRRLGRGGRWNVDVFASAVMMRMADGLCVTDAVVEQISDSAQLQGASLTGLLNRTGWAAALEDLDGHVSAGEMLLVAGGVSTSDREAA